MHWGHVMRNLKRATGHFTRRRSGTIEQGPFLRMPFVRRRRRRAAGGAAVHGLVGMFAGALGTIGLYQDTYFVGDLMALIAFLICAVLAVGAWTARAGLGARLLATLLCVWFPVLCAVRLVT